MEAKATEFSLTTADGWDRAGVIGSLVCIAHCVITPFLAAALPVLAVTEKQTHIGLTVILMLFGLLAFVPGYRRHSKPHISLLAVAAFAMLVIVAFIPEGIASESMETGLTVAGGVLLIAAHLTNVHYCRRCPRCADNPCKAD